MDDMARAVAQNQQRQSVRVCISASRRRFCGIGAQPDLRFRESRKHGAQLFVLHHLPCAKEKHHVQSPDALAACQQFIQKMLRWFASRIQP